MITDTSTPPVSFEKPDEISRDTIVMVRALILFALIAFWVSVFLKIFGVF